MSNIRTRLSTAVGCFLSSLILMAPPVLAADEGDRVCSNATLKGSYGFVTGAIVVPANTPRGVVGLWNFDGQGKFTNNTLTVNNDGTILRLTDAGTYTVNADCTGTILPVIGGGSIDIVIVDNGKEFYQLRTAPENLVLIFSVAKKQFPRNDYER
ncbi:MAG: hypothetical protein JO108_13670 [Acidobacteriaceae bacterium]|nr:hypothetical protein [Acidobacteriaceae bacterium]